MIPIHKALIYCLAGLCSPVFAASTDAPAEVVSATETLSGHPTTNLMDNSVVTFWSSNWHSSADNFISVNYWFDKLSYSFSDINYVTLTPRFLNSKPLAFPSSFDIYYSDGSKWVFVRSISDYKAPNQWNGEIKPSPAIIPLGRTVHANGIGIVAKKLTTDGNPGCYYFQISEAGAGFDPGLDIFQFIGNDPDLAAQSKIEVRGVSASTFSRNRLSEWHDDIRYPFHSGTIISTTNTTEARNIYGPSAVHMGGTFWKLFYGGWDWQSSTQDEIFSVDTRDDFKSFVEIYTTPIYDRSGQVGVSPLPGPSMPIMKTSGSPSMINNPSVVRSPDGKWHMLATYNASGRINDNKTIYATSSDGVKWTPNIAASGSQISVGGFSNFGTSADINGANALLYWRGSFYFYYSEYTSTGINGPFLATQGPNQTPSAGFSHNASAPPLTTNRRLEVNDVKAFGAPWSQSFVMLTSKNGSSLGEISLRLSVGGNPDAFEDNPFFQVTPDGNLAQNLLTGCIVSDGRRLLGVLYGANNGTDYRSGLESFVGNALFAKWLQKSILFYADGLGFVGNNPALIKARGPNVLQLAIPQLATRPYTGKFMVKDEGGNVEWNDQLGQFPFITLQAGDIWEYRP